MACSECDPGDLGQRVFAVAGCFGSKVFGLPYALNASDPYYGAIAQISLGTVVVAVLAGMRDDAWCKLYVSLVGKEGILDHQEFDFRQTVAESASESLAGAIASDWQSWMYKQDEVLCSAGEEGNEYTIDPIPEAIADLFDREDFRYLTVKLQIQLAGDRKHIEVFSLKEFGNALTYPQIAEGEQPLRLEIEATKLGKDKPYAAIEVKLVPLQMTPEKREVASIIAVSPFYRER